MSTDLKASVRLDMSGNLQMQARRSGQALGDLSRSGQRHMSLLSRAVRGVGSGLDRLGNRYTALFTGGGMALAGRQVMALETRFVRLGIQANKSAEEMDALKRLIFDVSRAPEIRVDPGEITGAIEAIIEKTGDLEFARQNIRNIGVAIQATGASGQAIGELMAELQKMGGFKGPDDVLRAIDTLTVQGKEGAFTLQNLAALGPRVITAYTSATKGARNGATVLREMGAALQVIRMGTGSSEQAATAFERLLAELQTADKIKMLQANGIQVFDPAQPGAEVLRPISELLLEILKKSGGRRTILGQVFGDEAMRAFSALSPERIEQFMRVQGDGVATMNDAARAAARSEAALNSLFNAWEKFADGELSGPIRDAADALNSVEPGTVDRWMQIAKWIAIIGGGLVLARKGIGAINTIRGAMGRNRALGGAAGGAAAMAGVTPVYVVNMPGAGLPGMGGPGKLGKAGTAAGKVGRSAGAVKSLRVLAGGLPLSAWGSMGAAGLTTAGAGVVGAGAGGYAVGSLINKGAEAAARGTRLEGFGTEYIGGTIARVLAALGHDESRRAVAADEAAKAELRVTVEDNRTRVTRLRSTGMEVDVDGGMMMVSP